MQEVKMPAKPKARFFYGYIVVIAIFFIMVFAFGTNFAFGVFFKPVQNEFGWTSAMTAAAFSLAMIVQGIMGIVMGSFTDRFGPRLVMTVSGLLLGIGYLLMSQINDLWQLYVYYGLIIGIGMSSGYVTLLSTVARWFNIRRNLMTGAVLIGMSIGTLVAPPVSDRLIQVYDWRTSYRITAVAVFIVVVLAAQFLKRDPSTTRQVSDGRKSELPTEINIDSRGFTLKEAVRKSQFWLFVGAEMCFGFILFSILVHIVPHAIALKIPDSGAAIVLSAIGGASIIGRIVLGNAADRVGNKKIFISGFIMLAIVLFFLALAEEGWLLYLLAAIFGFIYVGIETSESPMTAWLFGLKSHGLVFGVVSLFFTIGASLGPIMTGYIFDVTGQYRLAFFILAALGIFGLIFTVFLRSPARSENRG
jgi:MFS family permease